MSNESESKIYIDKVNKWWKELPVEKKSAYVAYFLRKPNGHYRNVTQSEKNKMYDDYNCFY